MRPGRVLVCALMAEYDRHSGSRRIYHLLEFLQEAGWAVSFVSHHTNCDTRYVKALERRGIAVYPGSKEWLEPLVATGDFDLVIFGLWDVAESYVEGIRRWSPGTRVVVDSIDLHFLRNARRIFCEAATQGKIGLLDTEYGAEMVREVNTYRAADAVLTVSEKEAEWVRDLVGDPRRADAVPDSESLERSSVPFSERAGIVFVGWFKHSPNAAAVEFLCRDILPRLDTMLLTKHPVYLVGDGMDEWLRRLAETRPEVRVVGWVPSVVPYLEHARVSILPLPYGAGTKRKLIEALMVGTPAVSTSMGIEGLNLRDGEHVLVADDAASFAEALGRLLQDQGLWERLVERGRAYVAALHGRDAARARLARVLSAVMAREPIRLNAGGVGSQWEGQRWSRREYLELVGRVREVVSRVLPPDATVLVLSKGDDALLELGGRTAWHFPQGEDGHYAGHHPADSQEALAHLEMLRSRGADSLLIPQTAFWWLDHYTEFRRELERRWRMVVRHERTCVIFALRNEATGGQGVVTTDASGALAQGTDPAAERGVRLIAFYLPQFHPIPENDKWWGKGFTDWTNVARARPLFTEHYQPHLPAELGFYDLRVVETRDAQAELARTYGIYGFCYYHYWFSGKRLLERPFNEVLSSGRPDFPFCLCWANEPWSRRWDGRPRDVLQSQTYRHEDDVAHIRWLMSALADPRAIRIEGKAVFLVYQGKDLPDPARTTDTWREEMLKGGLSGLYLISVETGWDAGWDATKVGFDAKVLFQPQFSMLFNSGARITIPGRDKLRVYDYGRAWPALARADPVSYKRYETVCTNWDNTPRVGDKGVVLQGATPDAYEEWLRFAIAKAAGGLPDHGVLFINAWNEWGEGCHLEPDLRHGRSYLEATRRALTSWGGVEGRRGRVASLGRQEAAKD